MKYEKMSIEEFVQATHTFRLGDKVGTTSVWKAAARLFSFWILQGLFAFQNPKWGQRWGQKIKKDADSLRTSVFSIWSG